MRIVTGTYRGRQIPSGRRLRQIRLHLHAPLRSRILHARPQPEGPYLPRLVCWLGPNGARSAEPGRERRDQRARSPTAAPDPLAALPMESRRRGPTLGLSPTPHPPIGGGRPSLRHCVRRSPVPRPLLRCPAPVGPHRSPRESPLFNDEGLLFVQHQLDLDVPEQSGHLAALPAAGLR